MRRGNMGTKPETKEEEKLEEAIVLEILRESRGDREDRGEREEWNQHVGWHRKEDIGGGLRQQRQQQQHPKDNRHREALPTATKRRVAGTELGKDKRKDSKIEEINRRHNIKNNSNKNRSNALPAEKIVPWTILATVVLFGIIVMMWWKSGQILGRRKRLRKRSTKGRIL